MKESLAGQGESISQLEFEFQELPNVKKNTYVK